MTQSLKNISAQYIMKILPLEVIETLVNTLWLPYICNIGNIIDNTAHDWTEEDDTTLLKEFAELFPWAVYRCKHQDRKTGIAFNGGAWIFSNDGGNTLPSEEDGLYFVTMVKTEDFRLHQQVIDFFERKKFYLTVGIEIRKMTNDGSDK